MDQRAPKNTNQESSLGEGDDFIQRFETLGDWGPTPWFLDPNFEPQMGMEWDAMGLLRQKRVTADAALRRIFPPDVVLGMKANPAPWAGHVVALFGGIIQPGQVADLLDLGVNAARATPCDQGGHGCIARRGEVDCHAEREVVAT